MISKLPQRYLYEIVSSFPILVGPLVWAAVGTNGIATVCSVVSTPQFSALEVSPGRNSANGPGSCRASNAWSANKWAIGHSRTRGKKAPRNYNSQEPMGCHSVAWAWCMLGEVNGLPPHFIVKAVQDR